mmetsp:Transcript_30042/g.80180  ORF Transcript_30042/g.80180 Transcript_30042/m.80180 type:complete len:273 (-) Transcript_30042:403-1221(-)
MFGMTSCNRSSRKFSNSFLHLVTTHTSFTLFLPQVLDLIVGEFIDDVVNGHQPALLEILRTATSPRWKGQARHATFLRLKDASPSFSAVKCWFASTSCIPSSWLSNSEGSPSFDLAARTSKMLSSMSWCCDARNASTVSPHKGHHSGGEDGATASNCSRSPSSKFSNTSKHLPSRWFKGSFAGGTSSLKWLSDMWTRKSLSNCGERMPSVDQPSTSALQCLIPVGSSRSTGRGLKDWSVGILRNWSTTSCSELSRLTPSVQRSCGLLLGQKP